MQIDELRRCAATIGTKTRSRQTCRASAILPLAALTVLSIATATGSERVFAADKPAVMAIVDGSGSMWGGLGNEGLSKLDTARKALETVLPKLAATHRMGLATFGPGCRAADLVVPPAEIQAEDVVRPLIKFNPRGKGPLTAGIRVAVEAFAPEAFATLVIMHDGLDNCGEDTCAAAAALHESHPNVTVHTVSLGMDAAEVAGIACVANATGGRAFSANDPESARRALDKIAALISEPTAGKPATAQAPPAAPELVTAGPSRLVATASLAEGRPQVATPLAWRVTDPATGALLHASVGSALTLPLPAGKVRVEASSGRVRTFRDVEIANEGDTPVVIPLEAGLIRFDTGAKRLASDAEEPLIRLHRIESGVPSEINKQSTPVATPLWIARGKAIEALLPPGKYRAVAEYGLARADASVTVAAGDTSNLTLPLEAGRLELSADAKDVGGFTYRIEIDDPDRPGGRRVLARSSHESPSFVLSTGTYYVTAEAGGRSVRHLVTVRSGEVTREKFAIKTATLTVTALLNGSPPAGAPMSLSVFASGESGTAIHQPTTVEIGRAVSLSPGRYQLVLTNAQNGAQVKRDVELAAGEQKRLAIDLETSEVEVQNVSAGIGRGVGLCEITDASGKIVWRSVATQLRAVVAPGQYRLLCRTGNAGRELTFTAAAGKVQKIAPFSQ